MPHDDRVLPADAARRRRGADDARPSLARLVRVELRKMTDTRAGFWLLLVTLLLALAGLILTIAFAPDEDRTLPSRSSAPRGPAEPARPGARRSSS